MTPWLRYPIRFRLICACLGFLVGDAVGSFWRWGVSEYVFYASLMLLGLFFVFRPYLIRVIGLVASTLIIGYALAASHLQHITLKAPLDYHGEAVVTSVRMSQPPKERVMLQLREGPYKGSMVRAFVYDWGEPTGATIRVKMEVLPSDFLSDRGYDVIGSAQTVAVEAKTHDATWLYVFRQRLQDRIGATLPEPYASFAVGLLTGANDNFDADFKTDLQRTGTTHLIAVSGYNLSIVALSLNFLGRRKSRWLGFGLAIGAIAIYIILAGATPSIVRGAIVATLSLSATVLGRVLHRLPLVLLSAVLLAIVTPLGMLYNVSWQLSFLAFVGILFISPVLGEWAKHKFGAWTELLTETLSAEVMVLPLVMIKFGSVSLISPLINGGVLLFVPAAMAVSGVQAVASLLSLGLGRIVAWITYPVLWLIIKPIEWGSKLSFAAIQISPSPVPYSLLIYPVVAVVWFFLWRHQKRSPHDA